jgi:Tol biopolymer transport system component
MNRNFYYRFCLIVLVFSHTLMNSSFGQDRSKNKMSYLNLTPPGTKAEIFAQGIVTYSSFNHASPTISPDCKEIYWPSKDRENILVSKLNNGKWSDPVVFSVLNGLKADCPVISPDGKRMLFNSRYPIDENDLNPSEKVWFIERMGDEWSIAKPLCLEINSDHLHWQVSTDLQGNVYFGSERSGSKGKDDIFVSRYIDGRYSHPVSMSDSINTELHESTPFIAPDGQYIIFSRTVKTSGYGQNDLFISFNKKDKGWTKAQSLGSQINTELSEGCPYISPDGQYLFFLRVAQGLSEIYWIRTKHIECFRN